MWAGTAIAQDAVSEIPFEVQVVLDTLWVILAAILVFFMNAGFAMVESGFCRAKNTVNILAKNLIVFAISSFAFWAIGFGLMFGDGNGFLGLNGFFLGGADNSPMTGEMYSGVFQSLSWASVPLYAKFFFQLAFAGTAATIVSGAVAERIKFPAFVSFSLVLVALPYSITGHWIWGGGWLEGFGFYDFAGGTAVHMVGGWAALTGAILLGPRIEKYNGDRINAIPGHNMSTATLGILILWLGWFGFNPGSTMSADPEAISHILVVTNMSAAAGALAAAITSSVLFTKPDLSMIGNGVLAGLVSITAGCAFVSIPFAIVIGAIGGTVVVNSVLLLERVRVDDPVGAISVHLVCGIWGTIAVGLFSVGDGIYDWYTATSGPAKGLLLGGGMGQVLIQLLGVVSVSLFVGVFSLVIWLLLAFTVDLRVSEAEEVEGLDIGEHGMEAYNDFFRDLEKDFE
ncbi:ammonium transporter [[Leptolyngbya] sp. PCC 7376]|uniref:ammonium transporter n=1 Tax=[Leptolyngbya] sp. PCC 7376 TaxID=111781 RepID=UPI0028F45C18|nr:ammonium transporter [[Leptolyngbya] sp. PCC 7376]